jgi:hypothetical protein
VQIPHADEDVGACWDAVLIKLILLKGSGGVGQQQQQQVSQLNW